MTAQRYFAKLKNIDELIQAQKTGRPKTLAANLKMSERMIYRYIQNLKDLGAPIEYSAELESYIYTQNVALKVEIAYEQKAEVKARKKSEQSENEATLDN